MAICPYCKGKIEKVKVDKLPYEPEEKEGAIAFTRCCPLCDKILSIT